MPEYRFYSILGCPDAKLAPHLSMTVDSFGHRERDSDRVLTHKATISTAWMLTTYFAAPLYLDIPQPLPTNLHESVCYFYSMKIDQIAF